MSALTALSLYFLRASSSHDENHLLSPFSLATSLATVHDGAKGETKAELTRLLGGGLPSDQVSSLYASYTREMAVKEERNCWLPPFFKRKDSDEPKCTEYESPNAGIHVTATVVNKLFVDKGCKLTKEYTRDVRESYGAEVENVNFSKGEKAAKEVNGMINKASNGRISQLVKSSAFDEPGVVLANVLHFKGSWETPFYEGKNVTKAFRGIRGDRETQFMRADDFYAKSSFSPDLIAVSLAYKDPVGGYSMVAMMPSGDFRKWRDELTAENMEEIVNGMKAGKIEIEFPKWSLEATTDGKATLQQLGVKHIFDQQLADLSVMSSEKTPLFVSKIAHKAVIEVDEKGTEASAATVLEFVVLCPPEEKFVFDRPFIYLIMKGDTVLFIGQHV